MTLYNNKAAQMQEPNSIIQGSKGLVGAAVTGAGVSTTWLEQANAYVDLTAGLIGIVAGTFTIVWYVSRFIKARGVRNDKTDSS